MLHDEKPMIFTENQRQEIEKRALDRAAALGSTPIEIVRLMRRFIKYESVLAVVDEAIDSLEKSIEWSLAAMAAGGDVFDIEGSRVTLHELKKHRELYVEKFGLEDPV